MHIGKRLKEMRKRSEKSQDQVGHGIISTSHFSNIEGGRFVPSQDILYLLADRLAVPYTYFEDIHIDDPDLAVLLKEYQRIIEGGELAQIESFYHENESKFEFIPSLNQELYFSLLRILDLINANRIEDADQLYNNKVVNYVDPSQVYMLSAEIREKYFYVTGLIHYIKKNYEESIHNFRKTITLTNDSMLKARLTFNIALSLYYLYEYTEALEYSVKAKDLYLNLHDWGKTAESYNLIALLYKEINDYKNAESYIMKGFDILNDKSKKTYAVLLHNLALIKMNENSNDEAFNMLNECIELKKQHNFNNLFISYRSQLKIYLDRKDYESFIETMELATLTCRSDSDVAHLNVFQAQLNKYQKNYAEYEQLMDSSINFFFDIEDWKSVKSISEEFADYFVERKQYKKAYQIQKMELHATKKIYREL
ncbi:tetratricopeptide repeat protein [Peribacillus psychrosaccharolyticus]|uniref:tetratricopeptide repeat protein n=1 Tax=Peribacillus psychrosaccharolyticus TaxID=1407 RepID=UPI003D2B9939